jgi:hypothetical protein
MTGLDSAPLDCAAGKRSRRAPLVDRPRAQMPDAWVIDVAAFLGETASLAK